MKEHSVPRSNWSFNIVALVSVCFLTFCALIITIGAAASKPTTFNANNGVANMHIATYAKLAGNGFRGVWLPFIA